MWWQWLCLYTHVHCTQYWSSTLSHLLVGQVEQKLPVKASRPPECWVDRVKSVCSTNDHYLPTTVQAVHQGQQSGHNRTARGKKMMGRIVMHVVLHLAIHSVSSLFNLPPKITSKTKTAWLYCMTVTQEKLNLIYCADNVANTYYITVKKHANVSIHADNQSSNTFWDWNNIETHESILNK